MNITLYKFTGQKDAVTKTLTQVGAVRTGSLKEGSSVLKPSIVINAPMSSVVGANYFYIAEFGQWYYMGDPVAETARTTRIEGTVDVLYTYRTGIRATEALIERQEIRPSANNAESETIDFADINDSIVYQTEGGSSIEVYSDSYTDPTATGDNVYVLVAAG